MHIALVTYKGLPKLSKSDRILQSALQEEAYHVSAVCWDAKVDWKSFDLIILRSCWDYHYRIEEFLTWIDNLERLNIKIINPVSLVKWNYSKQYLYELQQKNVPIIPTDFLYKNNLIDIESLMKKYNGKDIIIKPSIGASAYNIEKINSNEISLIKSKIHALLEKNNVLIQPFMEEIKEGELSLIFLGDIYSHTVLKKPHPHDFRSQSEYKGIEKRIYPNNTIIQQAFEILKHIGEQTLYARVDGLIINKSFVLNELELIEPNLFFDLFPEGAKILAKIIKEKYQ